MGSQTLIDNGISNDNTDINNHYKTWTNSFHTNRAHAITIMTDNINMDGMILASVNTLS
jgi:hypothetical protein